jgi:hypothetical protein
MNKYLFAKSILYELIKPRNLVFEQRCKYGIFNITKISFTGFNIRLTGDKTVFAIIRRENLLCFPYQTVLKRELFEEFCSTFEILPFSYNIITDSTTPGERDIVKKIPEYAYPYIVATYSVIDSLDIRGRTNYYHRLYIDCVPKIIPYKYANHNADCEDNTYDVCALYFSIRKRTEISTELIAIPQVNSIDDMLKNLTKNINKEITKFVIIYYNATPKQGQGYILIDTSDMSCKNMVGHWECFVRDYYLCDQSRFLKTKSSNN